MERVANVTPQMLKDNPNEHVEIIKSMSNLSYGARSHKKSRKESYYAGVGDKKAHITQT